MNIVDKILSWLFTRPDQGAHIAAKGTATLTMKITRADGSIEEVTVPAKIEGVR